MKYSIPYGSKFLEVDTRGNKVVFEGKMTNIAPVADVKEELLKALADYQHRSRRYGGV